ncbi:unnamed protein product [Arctia plantaginis]|uniref:Uncharacterized protein n=1 Tax=Arctia plantaginis TaxID=874455 RepID=A0A8S1BDJ5_ARCPL|nr:unnamed protein product [Arctia plantaginis]
MVTRGGSAAVGWGARRRVLARGRRCRRPSSATRGARLRSGPLSGATRERFRLGHGCAVLTLMLNAGERRCSSSLRSARGARVTLLGAATASGNFVRLRESSGAAERCCFVDVRANPGYVSIGGPLFYRYGATRVHCGGDDDEFDRHPVFGVLFGDSSYCGCTLTYCYCTTYISYT